MEAGPLCELDSLLNWKPSELDYFLSSSLANQGFSYNFKKTQVLLCHDLRGGYLEDRWRLGTNVIDQYRFWNWWKIDTFVYFSHNFVTIPPASWIDSAHRHGIKVLGTLITEWDKGKKMCSEFLKNENIWRKCANQLIEISSLYNFDGWLLNIENDLEPYEVPRMLEFVRYLTDGQKKKKDSTVLWYDSVTRDGKLLWQNELNVHNLSFFEACDGIFLNYAWDVTSLNTTSDICIRNNYESERVFLGCDVFGSECHCIDDYVTSKDLPDLGTRKRVDCLNVAECLERSRKHGLSFAMFAPSWSHEVLGEKNFVYNETRFWNKLEMNLNHDKQRKISALPIVTSFCEGLGRFYCCKAEKLSFKPWSNMSLQTLQALPHPSFSNSSEDSFVGGGCLRILVDEAVLFRLFNVKVDLSLLDVDSLIIKWVSKHPPDIRLVVIVTLESIDGNTQGTITEHHHLFEGDSKPRPDDFPTISHLLLEASDLVKSYEGSKIKGPANNFDWFESSHKINNVHGKTLKGLHLFLRKAEENIPREDLSLGYFEVSACRATDSSITSCMESFSTCEISVSISDGVLSISNLFATDPGYLNSFQMVFISKEDKNMTSIETAEGLSEAMKKEDEMDEPDPLEVRLGLYLKWRAGHGQFPSDGKVNRFHTFTRKSFATEDYSFLCASPISLVKLSSTCFGPEVVGGVCNLLVRVECFLYR